MKKEKVYIVVSLKHVLKTPGKKGVEAKWDRVESVEFVSQLRNRHHETSSAIGDYINRKMLRGERFGFSDYDTFETYVRSKYEKEMAQLDAAYLDQQVKADIVPEPELITDQFGNVREWTVFDRRPS